MGLASGGLHDAIRGGSTGPCTPGEHSFYLYLPGARRRIAEELPHAKLIVIVRDPIDRAYSNWMHLWVDGLEPIADFAEAWHAEGSRIAAGWAPFWHYHQLGRYGQQLNDLLNRVDRDRVLVLRYWQLVSQPTETLNRVARFLGIAEDRISAVPPDKLPAIPGAWPPSFGHHRAGDPRRCGGRDPYPAQIWRRVSEPWWTPYNSAARVNDRSWRSSNVRRCSAR